jgi:cardiolipin synthase A/B
MPVSPGNRLTLLPDYGTAFKSLIQDIDAATRSCHLEFYIWNQGGLADDVGEALLRAAARGIECKVLLDDVGSRKFLRSEAAQRLRKGGVAVLAALPARLWRLLLVRYDLRLHRKIAVIDGRIAYTGSQNLVDPRYFKQEAGVGLWVDAMVRVEGPAVEPLEIIFLGDWAMESLETIEHLRQTTDLHSLERRGDAPVQVIPSGPAHDAGGAMERILLSTIYNAQQTLTLTTPYFVPDEALLTALISAAQRGVRVTLIMPADVDSRLARLASRSIQGDLVAAGVRVLLFKGGLLHTKSVTVDGAFSLFGSLNLDPRSLHLNFEITLAIYDEDFTAGLAALQAEYAHQSRAIALAAWQARSRPQKLLENAARLLGPLL